MTTTKQWLIFRNGSQQYGIDILRVQELRGYDPAVVTRVAHAPAHTQGLINLRGQIIPVIDLRIKLGLSDTTITDQTVIVILNFSPAMVGIVVDSVSDVLALPSESIQPPPKSSDVGKANFLIGLASHDGHLIQILEIDKMIGPGGTGSSEFEL